MSTLLSVNNYHYYRGGAETVFLEHNRMFAETGWQVVPFAMQHARNLPTPWSKYFIDEIEFGENYSLSEKLVRAPRVVYSVQARRRLARLLTKSHPDICHAHNIYNHISPSILGLLKRQQIPVVLTLHDLKIACPAYNMLASDGICERCRDGRLYNVVLHRCIKGSAALSGLMMIEAVLHRLVGSYTRCVSRFVVPSRFYADKLQQWGFPSHMFRHVPNFVDVRSYEPRFGAWDGNSVFRQAVPREGAAYAGPGGSAGALPCRVCRYGSGSGQSARLGASDRRGGRVPGLSVGTAAARGRPERKSRSSSFRMVRERTDERT